jgi:stalled ribosome rescue protein Dom34
VALLVGFEADRAVLWQVFSRVAKPYKTLTLSGKRSDEKALYNFHESVVDALRPLLREGVRSVLAAAPMKTTYASDFMAHVRKHHKYLIQSRKPEGATFAELIGSADQPNKVAELVATKEFRRLIAETTSEETDQVIDALEKLLYRADSDAVVLFSLREIEDMVYNPDRGLNDFRTAYLLLTDKCLADGENKNRIHRLLQIAGNKKVKTRIVSSETPAGKRVSQLGGIVFFNALNDKS